MIRGHLNTMNTVGQILDTMKFSIKMILVEKGVGFNTESDVVLFSEIFEMLPEQWNKDPVKVCIKFPFINIFVKKKTLSQCDSF